MDGVAGRGTPAVDAATVYAQSRQGEVLAIERRTGTVRWRQRSSPPGVATAGSSVRRWDRLVIAGDEHVVAFEAATGAPAWRFAPETGHGPGHYLGEVAEGVVYAGSPSGHLYAVDAASGRERWRTEVAPGTVASVHEPAVEGGLVVAGYLTFGPAPAGGLVALDASDGRPRWRLPLASHDGSPYTAGWGGGLLVGDGRIVATGRDGKLWVISVADGSVIWRLPAAESGCPAEPDRPDRRPLTGSGAFVVSGSLSGCVASVDLDARTARWRFHDVRLGSTATRLASDGSLVYVPFLSGRLLALDRETGGERWRLGGADREFVWAPALSGRFVYLSSTSGFSAHAR
ncbi:MAG: PQQ-like beta-propeller repeat protein [Vicinamibacterales bacterium]|nr:PQQ-like beta-propeller repeat protein [Vicinamibacterales bacterium]